MKKLKVYSYAHCPEDQIEINNKNIQDLKSSSGTSMPEKAVLEALLNLINVESIETEYTIPDTKLRTDFRIHFINGMIRRCEVNGSQHFYGWRDQSDADYTTDWCNFYTKQVDALKCNEPCLNINCFVNACPPGQGFIPKRWKKLNNTLERLNGNKTFMAAIRKLTCSNLTKNINLNVADDVLLTKLTNDSRINGLIMQMENNPDYKINIR